MKFWLVILFFLFSIIIFGQNPYVASEGSKRIENIEWRKKTDLYSITENMTIKNIGPTIMSGRITDIDVNPQNTTEFYIAYASGGLWYSNNNGMSFEPKFDHEVVMTIGAIAVHWPSHTIYVGTGEVNSSRSSYSGVGIYKSEDKGKSWINCGLYESHHIGEIIVNPENPSKVSVAAMGHLYSPNNERGIFHTIDGGKTWNQTLKINENAGCVDLIADPDNPSIMYTASWQRERRAWNFEEAGEGSDIYKSIDGGQSWNNLTQSSVGFPYGKGKGRIGISLSKKDNKQYLFAIIDNNDLREKKEEPKTFKLNKKDFKTMTREKFDVLIDEDIKTFLDENNFPEKYNVKKIRSLIRNQKIQVSALAEYLESANDDVINDEVKGAEVYRSEDDGRTWQKTHEAYLDGLYYTYGYYFGQIKSEYNNPNILYILGVPLLKSEDGGKLWKNIDGDNMHGDHHVLWIDPSNNKHIINGNDGGLNISYDGGQNWIKCNTPSVGQFYAINVDYADNYNVYGGLQDNGVWYGRNDYAYSKGWQQNGQYPYKFLLGGDGMQVQIDKRDNQTVYTGFQFGNYFRINKNTSERKFITPKHELGDKPYRWNWQAPILLSSHNQDIVYMGANKLLRSMDKGENFDEISLDLTNGGIKGNVPYGTITAIDESSLKFGLIYAGTDDGRLHVTKNGGNDWEDISINLPKKLWVSRVQASSHEEGRVYVSLNGYRWDHFNPYLYVSEDYGKTWSNLSNALPHETINVVKEDDVIDSILYVGTDHGLYISMNKGLTFYTMNKDLPKVAVHDLVIQKKQGHLLIGTHGRSIYKIDVNPIRQYAEFKDKAIMVLHTNELKYYENWGLKNVVYEEEKKPKTSLTIFSSKAQNSKIEIQNSEGLSLFFKDLELKKGIADYEFAWEIDPKKKADYEKWLNKNEKKKVEIKTAKDNKIYPYKGEYKIVLTSENEKSNSKFFIK